MFQAFHFLTKANVPADWWAELAAASPSFIMLHQYRIWIFTLYITLHHFTHFWCFIENTVWRPYTAYTRPSHGFVRHFRGRIHGVLKRHVGPTSRYPCYPFKLFISITVITCSSYDVTLCCGAWGLISLHKHETCSYPLSEGHNSCYSGYWHVFSPRRHKLSYVMLDHTEVMF